MPLTIRPSTIVRDRVRPDPAEADAALAARLRLGDVTALDALFRQHAGDLLRLAAAITGSDADADDVVQDVFVGLPLALRGYTECGAFAAWLRGVTVRTALATCRRAGRRREIAMDGAARIATPADHPDERLALHDALRRLSDDQRVVFVLKMVAGYSHAEIGAALGVRSGTSEVRLFRALRRLRSLLTDRSESN